MKGVVVFTLILILATVVRAKAATVTRCLYTLESDRTRAVFLYRGGNCPLTKDDKDAVRVLTYDAIHIPHYELQSDDFADFPNLEELYTKGIGITSLSPRLSKPFVNFTIQIWVASHNKLTSINEHFVFAVLPYLTDIDLSFNQLQSITTKCLRGFRKLERINFSNNQIKHIDGDAFQSFPNLEHVDLSNNRITMLNEKLFTINNRLSYLNLTGNDNLTKFSYKIFSTCIHHLDEVYLPAKYIEDLDVSCNGRSRCLFKGFNETDIFASIKKLNASGNHFSVKQLFGSDLKTQRLVGRSLETLDLSGNDIEYLDGTMMEKFENLKHFRLNHANLTRLHSLTFAKNTKLEYLDLSDNKLTNIQLVKLTNLNHLDLRSNQLESVESINEIYGGICKNVRTVLLSKNNFTRGETFQLEQDGCEFSDVEGPFREGVVHKQ